jgi:NitT/TauT family transport system permease protein
MRYGHRYHQRITRTKRRHHRTTSLILLGGIIIILALSLRTHIDPKLLFGGFLLSLYRVVWAYVISLVLGIILGLLTVSSPVAENLLLPVMDLAQSFPTFAILPILIHYFGSSDVNVIIILVIAMLWPIVFNVITAVKEQRSDQLEASQVFGATGWRHFLYFRWPMLRPAAVTGSIVSWGQAWDTIVGAEIIAGVVGAGHYLGQLGDRGQSGLLALAIALYLLMIFVINQIVWLPLLHYYAKYQAES